MATWIGTDLNYDTAANWSPADIPDSAGETAVFENNGAATTIASAGSYLLGGYTFNAGAPSYTISILGERLFTGTGILNLSGTTQTIKTFSSLAFANSATASDAHIDALGGLGDKVTFGNNATAASATISITGLGFLLEFVDSATAGSATITIGAGSGLAFDEMSSGGSARIILSGDMLIDHDLGSVEIGSLEGDGHVHAVFGDDTLVVGSRNTDTTFSGILGGLLGDPNEGAFGLTKTGTGTLMLTGYAGDKYTLDTTISGGTLKAGGGHVLSAASTYDVETGGTLDLSGFNQTIGGLDGTGAVKLGAATLTVGSGGFGGAISGTGSLVVDAAGGGLVLYGTNTYTGDTVVKAGALHFYGGSAIADASTLRISDGAGATGVMVFEAETIGALADGTGGGEVALVETLTVGANNSSTSFSGKLWDNPSLPAGLIKIGTGTQTLSGDSTYSGSTTVNGGVLRIDGSIASAATVNSGGTLGGNGAVGGTVLVNAGGHLGPGASPGSLEIGGLFLKAGGILDIEIAGTTPGTQYDQLVITGNVILAGTLKGHLLGSAASVATGTSFTIIDNTGGNAISGTFAGLSEGAAFLFGGTRYAITYAGGDGNDVVITALDDTPRVTLSPIVSSLKETAGTATARQVASITIVDPDGGPSALSLSGADASLFTISGNKLLLKAGAKLDFETNPRLDVTVNVDNGLAPRPDASAGFSINIGNVAETISGNKKDNVLKGTLATEIINGNAGDDTIKAGGGHDTVRGGKGEDVVTGGKGEDVFVFRPGDLPRPSQSGGLNGKYDLITDFKPGTDVIDLGALDANSRKAGNQKFHFEGQDELSHSRGELVYEFYGSRASTRHTIVLGDVNGDGSADFRIVLKGHHHLEASDFIL